MPAKIHCHTKHSLLYQTKYLVFYIQVKSCLLEIEELKKDVVKNKAVEEAVPTLSILEEEAETIFLRDLNSNTTNEKDENEMVTISMRIEIYNIFL